MNFVKTTPRLRKEQLTFSSNSLDSLVKEPVHVYCRLRPVIENVESSCFKLKSPTVLVLTTPVESKSQPKEIHCRFKHIFTSVSEQKEVFDHVALPLLEDLLKGKNSLLFTYGVTGSGKTHTLTGQEDKPGIIPKCIHTLFNTINNHQATKFLIKPDRMNGFEIQTEKEVIKDQEMELRKKAPKSKTPRRVNNNNNEKLSYYNDGTKINLMNEMNAYSVFVSYVEIYNNVVYDLLDGVKNKIIREDRNRNMYVNGVVEIEVKSAEEAFEVFSMGQMAKRMAQTQLNSESSRSHSIFNIRLVQFESANYNNNQQPAIPEANAVVVSQLSLVDLAGSERTNRTNTTGARLREASSINNSLMTLRVCMDALRENQLTKSNKMVPYRESRLTLLFRNYFEGNGSIQMIVCVNPTVDDFDENVQVMNFAENTQDVKIVRCEIRTPVVKKTSQKSLEVKVASLINLFPPLPVCKIVFDDLEKTCEELIKLEKYFNARKVNEVELKKKFDKTAEELRKRLENNQDSLVNKTLLKNQKTWIKQNTEQKMQNIEIKVNDLEVDDGEQVKNNRQLKEKVIRLQNLLHEKDVTINQNFLEKETAKDKLKMDIEKMSKLKKQYVEELTANQKKDTKMEESNGSMLEEKAPIKRKLEAETENPGSCIETPKNHLFLTPAMINGVSAPRPNRRFRSRSADPDIRPKDKVAKVIFQSFMLPAPAMKKRRTKYCLVAQEMDTDDKRETKCHKGDIYP